MRHQNKFPGVCSLKRFIYKVGARNHAADFFELFRTIGFFRDIVAVICS